MSTNNSHHITSSSADRHVWYPGLRDDERVELLQIVDGVLLEALASTQRRQPSDGFSISRQTVESQFDHLALRTAMKRQVPSP